MKLAIVFLFASMILATTAEAGCRAKEYQQYKDATKSKFDRDFMPNEYCHALANAAIIDEAISAREKNIAEAKALGGMRREISEWEADVTAKRKDAEQCRVEAQKMADALKAAKAPAPKCPAK